MPKPSEILEDAILHQVKARGWPKTKKGAKALCKAVRNLRELELAGK